MKNKELMALLIFVFIVASIAVTAGVWGVTRDQQLRSECEYKDGVFISRNLICLSKNAIIPIGDNNERP